MKHYGDWIARAAQMGMPTSAHFELTYRCNLACKHCFQERDGAPDELSKEEWLRVVDESHAAGVLVVTLSGGEAMLSPHFWDIAARIRQHGMTFKVFTNGISLSKRNCRRLAPLRPSWVEISVFSTNAAQHDAVTGAPGSFKKAMHGLARLHYLGVRVKLKCPILDTSGADFRAVRKLAERFGAGLLFDPFISPKSNGDMSVTQCRGDDQILYEFFEDEVSRKPQLREVLQKKKGDAICGVARRFTTVAPDGRVLPCPRMQVEAGNVRQSGLHEIFLNAPLLKKLRSTTFGDLTGCSDCSRSGYCGRCSATAYLEDGDMFGPSSRSCEVARVKEQAWGVAPPSGAFAVTPKTHARLRVLA